MSNRTVLYVSGFSSSLRARDLAYEFERYGRLVRCDIPAAKSSSSSPFAFVEFRREDDAEDAYYDMHGRSVDGRRITVQWAKRPPSTQWRHDGYGNDRREAPRDRDDRDRDRRRSPPPRRRSPSPRRDRDRDDAEKSERRRSLSPRRGDNQDTRRDRESLSPAGEKEGNGDSGKDQDVHEEDRERRDEQ